LVGCLVGCLVGWLVGWLVGVPVKLVVWYLFVYEKRKQASKQASNLIFYVDSKRSRESRDAKPTNLARHRSCETVSLQLQARHFQQRPQLGRHFSVEMTANVAERAK
jgi:hypothetical protein